MPPQVEGVPGNKSRPGKGRDSIINPNAKELIEDIRAGRFSEASELTDERERDLAALIDHTILKPESTAEDILKLCGEADRYGFASAVTQPCWVKLTKETLKNPKVRVCGISGFPLGGHTTAIKAAEAAQCVEDGADEVDMVMNIGCARQGDWDSVERDIAEVVKAVNDSTIVKVIIECCLLTEEEKVKASLCAVNAGADFVKTSTGFSKWGAKASDVALIRRVVGPEFGVKASGGIRDLAAVIKMTKAGADRIGTSAGIRILGY